MREVKKMIAREYLKSRNRRIVFIVTLFIIALAIRLWWSIFIAPPEDSIFSDMEGYVQRAQTLVLRGELRQYYYAVLPYGTHYLYGVEMLLWGTCAYAAMAINNAIFAAVGVVAITIASSYIFGWGRAVMVMGGLASIWYPLVSYNGYFSSEVPFAGLLYLAILGTFYFCQDG